MDMKMKFQLLADAVAKPILAKSGSFDACMIETFLVMTVIAIVINKNWSSLLFHILKAIVSLERQSQDFYISFSLLFEDVGIALRNPVIFHKLKTLSAQNVFAFMPNVQALNIFPAGLLKVEKEIKDDLALHKSQLVTRRAARLKLLIPKRNWYFNLVTLKMLFLLKSPRNQGLRKPNWPQVL